MDSRNPYLRPQRGWFFRLKCWFTGTDPDILRLCPQRDHDSVGVIFWLQLGVWTWQSLIFSVAIHMMLAEPGQIRPELVGAAMLLASIIALIDSFMIIRSSWYLHGLEELKRGGLVLPHARSAQLKNGAFVGLRLLISVMLALLAAHFSALLLFRKEAAAGVEAVYHQKNLPHFTAAAARFDDDLAKLNAQRVQVSELIAHADADASALRRSAAGTPAPDPDASLTADRLVRLEATRTAAEADLAKAQTLRSRDLAVLRGATGSDAAAKRRWAEQRVSRAQKRVDAVKGELGEAQRHLNEARAMQANREERQGKVTDTRLQQSAQSRENNLSRLAGLETEIRQRMAVRERTIRASVEADPAHLPREDGLLARARALMAAMDDPWVLSLVILLDVTFFAIELGAVLAKTMTFVPATYSTMLAEQDYVRAYETSRSIAQRINGAVAGYDGGAELAADAGMEPKQEPHAPGTEDNELDPPDEDDAETSAAFHEAARVARARAMKAETPARQPRAQNQRSDAEAIILRSEPEPRRPRGRPPGSRNRPPEEVADSDADDE